MRLTGEGETEDGIIPDMFLGLSHSLSKLIRKCIGFSEKDVPLTTWVTENGAQTREHRELSGFQGIPRPTLECEQIQMLSQSCHHFNEKEDDVFGTVRNIFRVWRTGKFLHFM